MYKDIYIIMLTDDKCQNPYIFECSSTTKIWVEGVNQEKHSVVFAGYITLAGNQQWEEWCCLAQSIFLCVCTCHLVNSEILVHHDWATLYHTAWCDSLWTIRSNEGIEKKWHMQNVVFINFAPIMSQHHTMCWRRS